MQLEKVRNAFEKKGFGPNTYINAKDYKNLLNSLVRGEGFHDQVAEELWTQAAGDRPTQEIRVQEICHTIVDAQNILRTRISELSERISTLEREKRRLQERPNRESHNKLGQVQAELDQAIAEKESFEDDYRLVTEPFGIQMFSSAYKKMASNPGSPAQYDNFVSDTPAYSDHMESEELKILLYLTLIYGFVEVIMIYDKYDFLNLIVVTCLLSIYLMNFFDRIYIRFTLALLGGSIILDIVWLCLYANQKWNPPEVGNNSIYEVGYLRFIVFFTAALIPLKIAIGYFLFKYRNADPEAKYALSLGLMKIKLSANKANPISKGISSNFAAN